MSLFDKVAQMTEAEHSPGFTNASAQNNAGANNIRAWQVGSILSGGGNVPAAPFSNTPAGWANMVDDYVTRSLTTPLQIPLLYGLDTVHGDNNMQGATIFPHNIGIGASRDPSISFAEGQVTAAETRASGPQYGFARASASPATSAGAARTSRSARILRWRA